MSDTLKVYDSNQVAVSFTAIPLNSGRSDGKFVEIESITPGYKTKVGVDGQVSRAKTNDPRKKVTLSFMRTSKANLILTAIYQLGQAAGNGADIGVLAVKDLQGASVFLAPEAWITELPHDLYSGEVEVLDWEFECIVPTGAHVMGGN